MAAVNSDVVAFGSIKDGRLCIHNRREFNRSIAQFREGSEVEIEVTRRRATRSIQQNKWYWSCVIGYVQAHTGYAADDVHEFYKAKFLPRVLAFQNGDGEIVAEFTLGGSTRKLNTVEFSNYCEQIREWAASELDVIIPSPEDARYAN